VGFGAVPQQTPRAVTASPPSFVITPPLVTELIAIFVIALVVKVGIEESFLQLLINTTPNIEKIKTNKTITFFIVFYLMIKI
jgi:hypothetical protein